MQIEPGLLFANKAFLVETGGFILFAAEKGQLDARILAANLATLFIEASMR